MFLTFISCGKEKTITDNGCDTIFEIAPDLNHVAKDSTGNYIETPRFDYYEDHNFIIDKLGRIFYYPLYKPRLMCGTDFNRPEIIPPPDFINLQPYQIIELSYNQLSEFVKMNINKKDETNIVVIATARDTFKSKELCILFESLYHNNSRNFHMIRRITEEEKMVLKFKLNDEYYSPNNIEWDFTKIVFPKNNKAPN